MKDPLPGSVKPNLLLDVGVEGRRVAMGALLNTKANPFILASADASDVFINTWFSHLEAFNTVTAPAARRLSMYRGVMGKSVLSTAMLYRTRRCMARGVRYGEGLFIA